MNMSSRTCSVRNSILLSYKMLTTLKNRTLQERERLLASVVERLLPQPAAPTAELTEDEKVLLAEMRGQLRLDPTDNSVAAQTALLQLLNDEMSASIQSEPRRTQIKASLEQSGNLWLELGYNSELEERSSLNIDIAVPDTSGHQTQTETTSETGEEYAGSSTRASSHRTTEKAGSAIRRTTDQMHRHILLCIAGLTPQIITETLYALTQQHGERIDEIRVITTLRGRDLLQRTLLDPGQGKFLAFCRDYHLDPTRILFDETTIALLRTPNGQVLSDFHSVEESAHVANQIYDIVHALTSDPHTSLHTSVAGGYKTMSAYLTTAMQLFGRAQDQLSYVLISEGFETHPDFFYIPPTPHELEIIDQQSHLIKRVSTEEAEIHLANIPLISVRSVASDWLQASEVNVSAFVQQAQEVQEELDFLDTTHDLRINMQNKTIVVGSRTIRFSARELLVYAMLAYLRQEGRGENGFVMLDEITRADLDTIFRRITAVRGRVYGLEDWEFVPGFAFLPTLVEQLASKNTTDREDLIQTFQQTISRIKRKCEAKQLRERYFITTLGERGALRYGISIAPGRIIWDN